LGVAFPNRGPPIGNPRRTKSATRYQNLTALWQGGLIAYVHTPAIAFALRFGLRALAIIRNISLPGYPR
jgi:hypothetical protein